MNRKRPNIDNPMYLGDDGGLDYMIDLEEYADYLENKIAILNDVKVTAITEKNAMIITTKFARQDVENLKFAIQMFIDDFESGREDIDDLYKLVTHNENKEH